MTSRRVLVGCGLMSILLGVAVALAGWLAWPEQDPDRPPIVTVEQSRSLGPGTHSLGPYPVRDGHELRISISGQFVTRSFNHESGSTLHEPSLHARLQAAAFDAAGNQLHQQSWGISRGSCTEGTHSVSMSVREVTLTCSTSQALGPLPGGQIAVMLTLPDEASDDQHFVERASVSIDERPASQPGRGMPQLAAMCAGPCVVPLGLLLVTLGLLSGRKRREAA